MDMTKNVWGMRQANAQKWDWTKLRYTQKKHQGEKEKSNDKEEQQTAEKKHNTTKTKKAQQSVSTAWEYFFVFLQQRNSSQVEWNVVSRSSSRAAFQCAAFSSD